MILALWANHHIYLWLYIELGIQLRSYHGTLASKLNNYYYCSVYYNQSFVAYNYIRVSATYTMAGGAAPI